MPDSMDYGTSQDRALVPGSLTVYRHFAVDMRRGLITSMNYSPDYAREDIRHLRSQAYKPHAEVQEAVCLGGWQCMTLPHETPDKRCKCGFYAHYDPATDFYPNHQWGDSWARRSGCETLADMAMVRAVVEVSGTVVAGRLGVRAAKLKIKAIAIDWAKHVTLPEWEDDAGSSGDYFYYYWSTSNHSFVQHRPIEGNPTDEERREVERAIASIAKTYGGIRVYDDPAAMYADHPKADLSALGIDTTPRRPDPLSAGYFQYLNQLNQQAAQHLTRQQLDAMTGGVLNSVNKARYAFLTVKADLDAVADLFPDVQAKRPMTAFERAMEAKKNRPAPPGSGIDRRKKKL